MGFSTDNTSSDEDAKALLARTLQANKPWLDPSPIQGTYYMLRQPSGGAAERTGPFRLEDKPTTPVSWEPALPSANRVGSLIWTPLHHLAHENTPYSLRMVGDTSWNGIPVVAIEVRFTSFLKDQIGFGGQGVGGGSYSQANYPDSVAQIMIEPNNAVPLFIQTVWIATNQVSATSTQTWQFDPNFYRINGGVAPRALEWNDPTVFRESQEFQLFQGEWLFKDGQAWWGQNEAGYTPGTLIQSIEVTDLEIPFPRLTFQKLEQSLILSWPTYGRAGIALEAADRVQGPWSAALVEANFDITNVVVSIPLSKVSQYYRLRE